MAYKALILPLLVFKINIEILMFVFQDNGALDSTSIPGAFCSEANVSDASLVESVARRSSFNAAARLGSSAGEVMLGLLAACRFHRTSSNPLWPIDVF